MRGTFSVAALLACGLLAGPALGVVVVFPISMTGAQEAPSAGDPDGTCTGTLTIDSSTNTISWNLTYALIATPLTGFHIHPGVAGASGGVLVSLGTATSGGAGTLISSVVASATDVTNILANPVGFYINVHNGPFPSGALRDQLPKVVNVKLTGAQETPSAGDPDGVATGSMAFNTGSNRISWNISYSGIDRSVNGFHIHPGGPGVSGGVLVSLGIATTGGPGTLISSTTTSAANMTTVLGNLPGHYINIHNSPFPSGAVRGQLQRVGDLDGDGDVDGVDLANLLGQWTGSTLYAPCPPFKSADFNHDCMVNGLDLPTLLGDWAP